MKFNKSVTGLIVGVLVAILIWFVPLAGLSTEGHLCLALSLMTVIFWAFGVTQPGYTSGLYLVLLAAMKVAPTTLIFSTWTTSMMYLIIGAYLIATAVKESGLGERIAYWYIDKYVSGYNSIIVSIFVLTFILSLLIPHPWPRAFLIMSVMAVVIKSANIPQVDAVKIGFTVFTASIPVSMIFLTGDASINPLAAQYTAPVDMGWMMWFKVMGVPVQTLLFLTAAVAIGKVGGATGMNAWLAQTFLPSQVPGNMFVLGAFITVIALVIHMLFGSVIAVMGIVIPAMLAFTQSMGISPIIPTMLAYSVVNTHFVLPFHNLAILVGTGPENGMYSEKETVRFGIPFIVVLFIISCVIELPWWKVIGIW